MIVYAVAEVLVIVMNKRFPMFAKEPVPDLWSMLSLYALIATIFLIDILKDLWNSSIFRTIGINMQKIMLKNIIQ